MAKSTPARSLRTRKIAVLAAGVLVVGLGATYTLASWTDSEWVFGGAAGDPTKPGVGTSKFEVTQNTALVLNEGTWTHENQNRGGALTFTTGAVSLSPGKTVYAPVSLRTEAGSVGGDVLLKGAVGATGITPNDDGSKLWDAMRVSVYTSSAETRPTCNAAGISNWGTPFVSNTTLNNGAASGTTQALPAAGDAAAGEPQHYCFALTLPEGASPDLQGRSIAPAWEFLSTSK